MRLALVIILVAACRFEPGSFAVIDAPEAADDVRPIDAPLVDAIPADARECPAGPPGCDVFTCDGSSSCYYLCGQTGTTKASWYGAKGSCEGTSLHNSCIVTINTQQEQDCIVQHAVPTFQTYVWFGYRQSVTTDEPDGNWGWECGPSSYVQGGWGGTEPNDDGGDEDCAAMTGSGTWFDANCGGTARYVCELP